MLTIDRAYFGLTGGLERWLYRIVRKHAGHQHGGWRFEFRHLHAKSASLSPFKRFAFELRDIARRQALPGYRLAVRREPNGREILVFSGTLSTAACGQGVDAARAIRNRGARAIGNRTLVPSGTEKAVFINRISSFRAA